MVNSFLMASTRAGVIFKFEVPDLGSLFLLATVASGFYFTKDRILHIDLSDILSCFLMVARETLALHNSMATLLSSLEKGLVECLFIARMLIVICPMRKRYVHEIGGS